MEPTQQNDARLAPLSRTLVERVSKSSRVLHTSPSSISSSWWWSRASDLKFDEADRRHTKSFSFLPCPSYADVLKSEGDYFNLQSGACKAGNHENLLRANGSYQLTSFPRIQNLLRILAKPFKRGGLLLMWELRSPKA